MEASSVASFSIACRLMTALRGSLSEAKRSAILVSFLAKFSTKPEDVIALFSVLLCAVSNSKGDDAVVDSPPQKAAVDKQLAHQLLEEAVLDAFDVLAVGEIPFAIHGSMSLVEAIEAVRLLRKRPMDVKAVRVLAVDQCTAAEWKVLQRVAVGDRSHTIGVQTKPQELFEPLGPAAVFCFSEVFPRNISKSVASACDGSPRMVRESSGMLVNMAEGDKADAFASDDDTAGATIIRIPSVVPRKRAREDDAPSVREAVVDSRLPACKYGAGCIRKNPQHFKEFSHPSPVSAEDAGEATKGIAIHPAAAIAAPSPAAVPLDPKLFAINGVAPLQAMKEHEFVVIDAGGGHKMKNCGNGTYTCSCPVWRYQNKAVNARTCKHLREYLGEAFENERCAEPGSAAAGAPHVAPHGAPAGGKKHAMPGVLLANKALPKLDYTGWWLSEKLDGVRAYWDGTRLLSRNGNEFTAPLSFTSCLPKDVTLDGELFGGRKKFQSTVGIVKSSAVHPGWATLTYEVFDMPSIGGQPFEERLAAMIKMFPADGARAKHVHVVEQTKCEGASHVTDALAAVEALGGEGLMLREPRSKYVCSRSNTLLKVKSTEEVDAIVRAYDPGKGKHAGRCGALQVELANGKQFCVGSGLTDAQRSKPPAIGTVIIVRFQELTDGGIPRFPVFAGCRFDIDWPPKAA